MSHIFDTNSQTQERPITAQALAELLDYRVKAQARTGRSGWTRYQSSGEGADSDQTSEK